jgi:hypothetical protein
MEGEQLTEICERSEEMWDLWHSDSEYFSGLEKESYVEQLLARNRYYAKRMTPEAYRDKLLEIYHNRDKCLASHVIDGRKGSWRRTRPFPNISPLEIVRQWNVFCPRGNDRERQKDDSPLSEKTR